MINPFFENKGPIKINDILNFISIAEIGMSSTITDEG